MSNYLSNFGFSLEIVLLKHTKTELLDICRVLEIKGVSNLKKADLIDLMRKRLPEAVAEKMQYWDQPIYDLVKKVSTTPAIHRLETEIDDFAEDYVLDEFIGFIADDPVGDYLIIPQEIQELFLAVDSLKYEETIKLNTLVARLSKGVLHYYGLLPIHALAESVNEFLDYPVPMHSIWKILWEIAFYTWDIMHEPGYFYDGRLMEFDYLLSELEMKESLEYRLLTFKEVWQAGDPRYFHDQAPQIQDLLSFLKVCTKESELPFLMDLLVSLIHTDLSPPEVVMAFAEYLDLELEDEIKELAVLVFDVYHTIPHWTLKGYSPEEIMNGPLKKPRLKEVARTFGNVYDFQTKQRIGRNTPCPCGSGRKFKYCCGRS